MADENQESPGMEDGNSSNNKHIAAELQALAGKYLTFQLADEIYGVSIIKVREIIGVQDITRVPDCDSYLKGVINLRGQVIAVMDLRLKFGMEEKPYTEETSVIIIEAGETNTGLIVDEVDQVIDLEASDLEPCPAMSGNIDTQSILAMGKSGKKLIMILDSDCILATKLQGDEKYV